MVLDNKDRAELQAHRFRNRGLVFAAIAALLYCILIGRFFYLQVFQYDRLITKAESNRKTEVAYTPSRGIIADKNGELLAANEPQYSLEMTPARVANVQKTLNELGTLFNISRADRRRFARLKDELPRLSPVPVKVNLTDEEVARFIAQAWRFPGVEVRSRLHRYYPQGKDAAHVVGYIGRISQANLVELETSGKEQDYSGTINIGKIGLELSYEDVLHGYPGLEQLEVKASGRPIRSLSRSSSIAGSNLELTLDMRLQRKIIKELGDNRAAFVAIEPSTGDILAFVSNPTFDPNPFVDGIDQETWDALNKNPDKPLLNRALRGTYSIGSTIKPFLALTAAQMGIRDPKKLIDDNGIFRYKDHVFRDTTRGRGHGMVDMKKSIVVSSDVYYYSLAQEMGIDRIHEALAPFGFGQLTGIDLENENRGILPSREWKMERFDKPWIPGDTISVGIGQGYSSFTMLQLAHALATVVNDGVVMTPHLVKKVVNPTTGEEIFLHTEPAKTIELKKEYVDLIKSAMREVATTGTARRSFASAPYSVGAKTGTAQVLGIKKGGTYDKNKVEKRYQDHSLFIAFAPYEKPTIALAVIVENGGFGSDSAAPLVRKVLDYYFSVMKPVTVEQKQEEEEKEEEQTESAVRTQEGEEQLIQDKEQVQTQNDPKPATSKAVKQEKSA